MADNTDPFALSAGVPPIEGELRPKPPRATRISKRVIGVAIAVVVLVVGLFLFSIDQIDNKPEKPAAEAKKGGSVASKDVGKAPADLTGKGEPGAAAVPGATNTAKSPSLVQQGPTPEEFAKQLAETLKKDKAVSGENDKKAAGNGSMVPGMGSLIPPEGSGKSQIPPNEGGMHQRPLTPAEQAAQQAENERNTRLRQARAAGLSVKPFTAGNDAGMKPGSAVEATKLSLEQASKSMALAGENVSGRKNGPDGDQDEKLDFIKNAQREERSYHPHVPIPPISEYEVKFGDYIPMRLESGINSDQPGEVKARVRRGVYDTKTGCYLLVPPMSTAIGRVDSKVAIGQQRNLVIWTGLRDPDGNELNLAGMQAYDTSGAAGLEADVDNHYLRLFGVALGMSLVTASVQISVPQPTTSATGTTPQTYGQQVSTALGQQYGQLGGQLFGKYASVQPTLRNYPGEEFEIMVPRTIIFKKVWANRCAKPPSARP